jgi:NAD(P)-dependent dehydrogenase (short-subunit alcohol dehydrogenase family)
MNRGILIAGNESPLFSAFCLETSKRTESYAAACIQYEKTAETPQESGLAGKQLLLEWNSSSPIAVRTLVLSAVNRMERIDNAVLICAPPSYRKTAEELSPAEIDTLIDSNIKGWFFLVRELTTVFRSQNGGTLSFIVSDLPTGAKEDIPDIIGPAAAAVFRAFAQRVLTSSAAAPYNVMGFSSSEPGEENAFAAFVFKIMEDEKRNSGKWHKYGKLGLFGR